MSAAVLSLRALADREGLTVKQTRDVLRALVREAFERIDREENERAATDAFFVDSDATPFGRSYSRDCGYCRAHFRAERPHARYCCESHRQLAYQVRSRMKEAA